MRKVSYFIDLFIILIFVTKLEYSENGYNEFTVITNFHLHSAINPYWNPSKKYSSLTDILQNWIWSVYDCNFVSFTPCLRNQNQQSNYLG